MSVCALRALGPELITGCGRSLIKRCHPGRFAPESADYGTGLGRLPSVPALVPAAIVG
jgi:hypothetical protein